MLVVFGRVGLGPNFSSSSGLGWIGLGQSDDRLGWIGSHKMDPWTTLVQRQGRPGAGETICSRRWQFAANQTTCVSPCMDPKIAANLRPSADGSAVRTCLVAGGG